MSRRPLGRGLFLFSLLAASLLPALRADDDVMLQGFYWDAPQGWYKTLAQEVPDLGRAGFTAVWLPPPSKAAEGAASNGYDPYDHYDLGEFDQKGSVATRWGTKQDLLSLLGSLHDAHIQALADVVLNHMTGADAQEKNPFSGATAATRFDYRHPAPAGAPTWAQVEARLGRSIPHAADEPYLFKKTWMDFHPSQEHPDSSPPYHDPIFGSDLCQQHDYVGVGLKLWGDWLVDSIGYDGFRLDYVKGLDPGYLNEWLHDGSKNGRLAVLEVWDDADTIERYVRETGARAFDFPLFYKLREMCNDTGGGFDMRALDGAGFAGRDPERAVAFVENHDTDRSSPIVTDKMMAYAFILALARHPVVFYKDYSVYHLRPQIDALIAVRRRLAGGATATLYKDPHLFIAQRAGSGGLPGLVLVLNNDPKDWESASVSVRSDWAGKRLKDYIGTAPSRLADPDGRVLLSAPPRGYAVYSLEGIDVPAPRR